MKQIFMTYEEAREYAKTISKTGSVLGLESIKNLMHELLDVQEELAIIHIAGTNGKGSVGTFLSTALMEEGFSVGRYISPAVFAPLEVWQINGTHISMEDYASIMSQVKNACDALVSRGMPHPTIFEVETALAFLYFYEKKCDYVLLETGMGGETDATNLITHPVCAVITSIGMDHMQFLGGSLLAIARAKAGIIKASCPVVTAHQKPEVMQVLLKIAEEKGAHLHVAEKILAGDIREDLHEISYQYKGDARVVTHLTGTYQIENSLLAVLTLEKILKIPMKHIVNGIRKAVWPGRFEILGREPLFIIDGAHNEDAVRKLGCTMQNYFTNRPITYIIGVLSDKERRQMLERMLPFANHVFTVTPNHPRALDGQVLAEEAKEYLCDVEYCDSPKQAVDQAIVAAGTDGVVLAFGSLSYLGEIKRIFCGED